MYAKISTRVSFILVGHALTSNVTFEFTSMHVIIKQNVSELEGRSGTKHAIGIT